MLEFGVKGHSIFVTEAVQVFWVNVAAHNVARACQGFHVDCSDRAGLGIGNVQLNMVLRN